MGPLVQRLPVQQGVSNHQKSLLRENLIIVQLLVCKEGFPDS